MKTATFLIICCNSLMAFGVSANNGTDSLAVTVLLHETAMELRTFEEEWESKAAILAHELWGINRQLDSFNMVTAPRSTSGP